jgi:hypothetical protein
MVYRIRDWEGIYENNRTRELREMRWLPLPIKLAGDGYTALTELRDPSCPFLGPAIFGAFVALVEVAAGCEPRGRLVRSNGAPHDAVTLARITRMPVELVERMLTTCVRDLQWIEIVEETGAPQEGATKGATSAAGTSQEGAPSEGMEGMEGIHNRGARTAVAVQLTEEYRIYHAGQFPTAHPDRLTIKRWEVACEAMLDARRSVDEIRKAWALVGADEWWKSRVTGLDKLKAFWDEGKLESILGAGAPAKYDPAGFQAVKEGKVT